MATLNDIIKEISNDKNVNVTEYIENNLATLVKLPLFNTINTRELYDILNSSNIDPLNMFIIINKTDNNKIIKLLYYNSFFNFNFNYNIETLLLLKLLNYENIYTICCSNNPFIFIKKERTLTIIIRQLKEIYIYTYNENIKYKCLQCKGITVIIQKHYLKFNMNALLSKLKRLIEVLEYIYKFHITYYEKEKEFYELDCKNQLDYIFYSEIFSNFVEEYRPNNKITDITSSSNDESIGNIDDILQFLFIK